jgi:hypothetical protein
MARVWFVRVWCVLFALLSASGAHAHRLASPHENGAVDPVLQDSSHHSATHAHDLANPDHEHLHAAHGATEVYAPAKAFGKSPVKADLFLIALASVLIIVLHRTSRRVRLVRSSRCVLPRLHSWYLPPTQAPPRTA